MSYPGFPDNPLLWPGLAETFIVVGGIAVTCEAARQAALLLKRSRTSAIAPVLAAASSPLAGCNYFAAAAPYVREIRRTVQLTGRVGAAGRHVTKIAFIRSIADAVEAARRADVAFVLRAFASDERYAALMASEALRKPRLVPCPAAA